MEIADLNLSVRAFNAVCRAGLKTIPELYHKYQLEPEWLHREIGPKNTHEVGDALALHREEVWEELRKEDENFREPMAGDYLCDYDPEIWGEEVTFDELAQMVGQLVIVNDSWYPEDDLEEDGEGDVLLVTDAEGDVVHLRGDTPKIYEITRLAMDDSVKTRYCTKVWKLIRSEEEQEQSGKGKESEEAEMIVFTTKLPPAPAEATTPEYLAAFNLNARIHCCKDNVERGLAEMCVLIEQMHSEKQYKQLGYQNFEDYCQQEFGFSREQGRKYTNVGKMLKGENANSSWHFDTIGINKLHLLSELDEPTRQEVTETVDMESVTVKELKAQIAKLEADKDAKAKQFQAALESKDAQLRTAQESRETALSECKTYLNGRIRELEDRIRELEDMPVQHDLTDADAAEEIKRLKRELEDEQLRYTMLEGSANARARKAADEVRAEYEKKLAEVQSAEKPDTKAVFKAYLANAADAMKRLLTYLESVREDENLPLYIEKLDGIVEMTQERRNAL